MEAPKDQRPDAATAFRNDFFDKNPDLLPYEGLIDHIAFKLQHEYNGRFADFTGQHPAWNIAVKLQASGYKGGSREAVMEAFAEATRQEIARHQQPPPIVGVGQSDRAATSNQNTPREWVELDRREEYREEHESTKVFLYFWGLGLLVCLLDQAPTAALSWFLGFPIARWIYLKIKKRYNG
jgi:hypothetical protein